MIPYTPPCPKDFSSKSGCDLQTEGERCYRTEKDRLATTFKCVEGSWKTGEDIMAAFTYRFNVSQLKWYLFSILILETSLCPSSQPKMPNSKCDLPDLTCYYGKECCCGDCTYSSFTYSCVEEEDENYYWHQLIHDLCNENKCIEGIFIL